MPKLLPITSNILAQMYFFFLFPVPIRRSTNNISFFQFAFTKINFKDPTRCLAAAGHFLIRKKLFNSKCTQLHVAKDFAVAEKKLHLAVSKRKYDPGKKASKKKCTSDVKTADPKPSTSQDKSVSEQALWHCGPCAQRGSETAW